MNSALIGSAPDSITIGIVVVVCFAAAIAGVLGAMIRSTFEPTSSAASEGKCLEFPFAYRYSIISFFLRYIRPPLNLGRKPQCYDSEMQTKAEETPMLDNRYEQLFSAAGLERGQVNCELN